ncbi:hypothetical protein C2G38_2165146 [Gigaspora rosea]|uniref:Uncharacterized protein n=1 Tax=Gigaspora rosea TaxID=44941 RepID=A0A397VTA1_9GLOM|nr:hypothetical protein C2G38_2165146 [Gigaspora rosea]
MTQSINKSDDELFVSDDEHIVDNDNDDNIIQRCTGPGEHYLRQLSGAWEIDSQAVKDVKRDISALRICLRHLNFDQRTVHEFESKKEQSTNEMYESIIQAPCVGLFKCPAITEYEDLLKKSLPGITDKPCFICTSCFVKNGGHLQIQPKKKGESLILCVEQQLHETDTKSALKFLAKWIEQTAELEDESKKISILKELVKLFNNITTDKSKMENTISTSSTISTVPRSMLASSILQERSELKKKLSLLEEPKSFDEYYLDMPSSLVNFFYRLILTIKEKKLQVLARKRKERNMPPPQLERRKIELISSFFASVILTIAFPQWKIWFMHILSSLCRRPKMIGVLYKILYTVRVLAYVKDHEVPIDNIDLKDANFQYGNIFNVVRNTAHATARMVFQYQYLELVNLDDNIRNYPPFGIKQTFNIEHINEAIKANIDSTLFVDSPNVVILKPGKAPSKDEHVHKAVDMFLEDFGYTEDGVLNLVCDEAICRHMKSYKSYGLFGLATQLSVKFLDKLEQFVDYRATFRVLELLWTAPQLLQNLRTVPSINLTQEGHYFAFDEALETFGIKFLKENMTGCATNLENLELNIKAAQTEYD